MRRRRRTGAGQLRHEPAAAARRRRRTTWSPSTPTDRVDERPRARPDGLRTPRLHPASRSPPSSGCRELNTGGHRVRRRLPRLGLPRGRLPLRRRGRRGAGGALVTAGDRRPAVDGHGRRPAPTARPRCTSARSRTSAPRRCATPSGTARTCGWSTSTTCPAAARRCARWPASTPRDHLGGTAPLAPRQPGALPRRAAASTCDGGRVLMLAHARVLGYVFNPLTVYWCHDAGRRAGVRRRRGAQHLRRAALLPAAPRRARPGATSAKEFYVSPFFPVRRRLPDAAARARRPARADRTLDRDGGRRSPRRVRGRRRPATARRAAAAAVRHPLSTLAVSAAHPAAGHPALPARAAGPAPRPPPHPGGTEADASPSPPLTDRGRRPPRPGHARRRRSTRPRWPGRGPRRRARSPLRTALTRLLVRRALDRLPLRVAPRDGPVTGDGGPLLRLRDPRGVLPPGRRRRPDRLRRGLHGRRVGRRRPGRRAHRARRARRHPGAAARCSGCAARGRAAGPARRRNTPDGARQNIHRHYDLSNDLFALFLDETMTYSSARLRRAALPGSERAGRRPSTARSTGCSTWPGSDRGHPGAGDRHRLGRAGDPGRRAAAPTVAHASRSPSEQRDAGPASGSPRPGSPTGSPSSCCDYREVAGRVTTPWSASR